MGQLLKSVMKSDGYRHNILQNKDRIGYKSGCARTGSSGGELDAPISNILH